MFKNISDHEINKFDGSYSRLDRVSAFWRLTWPFWVMASVSFTWLGLSRYFCPEEYSSAGAVLVCVSILSEIWLRQCKWRKDYLREDVGQPLKVVVQNRNEHWWGQYFIYPSDFGANGKTDPYKDLIKMGDWAPNDSIGCLLELVVKKEFTFEPFNAPSLNPYTVLGYDHGWYIAQTGSRIELYISICIGLTAVAGTLIWAYA